MENAERFHSLYGKRKPRINYQKKDFFDYALMATISALVVYFSYGISSPLTWIGISICLYMVLAFLVRHGFAAAVPVIVRRPQDILYMFVYKIENIKPVYLLAVGLLILENYLIHMTPGWAHNTEFTHTMALYAFYLHFLSITAYRTVILFTHLAKKKQVQAVLSRSIWKTVLKRSSVTFEIVHAYLTGVVTHIILIAPWYIIISYANYSLVLLPLTCVINLALHYNFYKVINSWFYRDHWLGHNSEFEFLYLHGTHHDAIPSGLIGVAGNGYLEGFLRHTLGFPYPFYNPIVAFLTNTLDIKKDIDSHQYIPGIYPEVSREFQQITQHSIHHFGRLAPYGFAMKLDLPTVSSELKDKFRLFPEELKNSAKLEEELGFEWENARHKWYLDLLDRSKQ